MCSCQETSTVGLGPSRGPAGAPNACPMMKHRGDGRQAVHPRDRATHSAPRPICGVMMAGREVENILRVMIPVSQGDRLLHLAGFGTGILLYAMLGMMVVRAARVPGGRRDNIPLATAVLGLLWNAGAISLYGLRDLGLTPGAGATPIQLAL